MWPWTFVRERLDAIADQVLTIRDIVSRPAPTPPPAPAPWVCVLVEAVKENGEHTTMGGTGRANERGSSVELTAQVPLSDVLVVVFVDLERVNVHGIFLGVDLVTANLGSCPIARFQTWPVGVKLSVQCLPVKS